VGRPVDATYEVDAEKGLEGFTAYLYDVFGDVSVDYGNAVCTKYKHTAVDEGGTRGRRRLPGTGGGADERPAGDGTAAGSDRHFTSEHDRGRSRRRPPGRGVDQPQPARPKRRTDRATDATRSFIWNVGGAQVQVGKAACPRRRFVAS
jgi:hypothetical protein